MSFSAGAARSEVSQPDWVGVQNGEDEVVMQNKLYTGPPMLQQGAAASKKQRHAAAQAPCLPSPAFGRDTGYICQSCRVVVWDPTIWPSQHSSVWKFCPCCASELVESHSQISYSDAAQEDDMTIETKIEALLKLNHAKVEAQSSMGARERSKRSSTGLTPCSSNERVLAQSDRPQAGARASAFTERGRSAHALVSDSKWLRTKPPKQRRRAWPYNKKTSASGIIARLKQQKMNGQSRFCDVCGHKNPPPEVKCYHCPSSFHNVCLGMQPSDVVTDDWICHACKRLSIEQAKQSGESTELLPIAETARTRWKPPDTAMQCSSCGYHETEAMNCDSCSRWFCFACMCLSAETLPANTWSCPECIGQDRYDEGRRVLIEASCRRVREGKVTTKEQDGFSQLVFDLSCTCDWDEWERNIDALIDHVKKQLEKGEVPVVMPFHSLHYARKGKTGIKTGMDKSMIKQISIAYSKWSKEEAYKLARVKMRDDGQGCEEFHVWKPVRLKFAPNDQACRLRIGYLSSDFVDHPTADLIQSALLNHDRKKFEIFCYSISREDDSDYRKKLSGEMEHFKHFDKKDSDKKCAEAIAADGIHILVNLNGHTAGDRNGISALRPAPIQLVYLAYPGTMGADYIDYNVTDKVVCPHEHREFYTERLLYMPHCYQVNSFRDLYRDVLDRDKLPTRQDHQLPVNSTFVYCNFCRLGRITPDLFEVWMNILKKVPDSVLWLYKHPKAAVWRLQSQAEKAGVAPERLIFGSPCSPKLEHLKRVTLADLALDTLVYNGHTTASDMLWAGVPLITMRGDNWPSLVATCIAEAAEMGEMVVESLKEYEERAVELAKDKTALKKLKAKLAEKRMTAPLFDSIRWIRDFEKGLDEIWRRYAEKEPDGDIVVKDIKPGRSRPRLQDDAAVPKVPRISTNETNARRPSLTSGTLKELVPTGAQSADESIKSKDCTNMGCDIVIKDLKPPTPPRPVRSRPQLQDDAHASSPVTPATNSTDERTGSVPSQNACQDESLRVLKGNQFTDASIQRKVGTKRAKVGQKLQQGEVNVELQSAQLHAFPPKTEIAYTVAVKSDNKKKPSPQSMPLSSSLISNGQKKHRRMQNRTETRLGVSASSPQGPEPIDCAHQDASGSSRSLVREGNMDREFGSAAQQNSAVQKKRQSADVRPPQMHDPLEQSPTVSAHSSEYSLVCKSTGSPHLKKFEVPTSVDAAGPRNELVNQPPLQRIANIGSSVREYEQSQKCSAEWRDCSVQAALKELVSRQTQSNYLEGRPQPQGNSEERRSFAETTHFRRPYVSQDTFNHVLTTGSSKQLSLATSGEARKTEYLTPRIPKKIKKPRARDEESTIEIDIDSEYRFPDPFDLVLAAEKRFEEKSHIEEAEKRDLSSGGQYAQDANSFEYCHGNARTSSHGGFGVERGACAHRGEGMRVKTSAEYLSSACIVPAYRPASLQMQQPEDKDDLAILARTAMIDASEFGQSAAPSLNHGKQQPSLQILETERHRSVGSIYSMEEIDRRFMAKSGERQYDVHPGQHQPFTEMKYAQVAKQDEHQHRPRPVISSLPPRLPGRENFSAASNISSSLQLPEERAFLHPPPPLHQHQDQQHPHPHQHQHQHHQFQQHGHVQHHHHHQQQRAEEVPGELKPLHITFDLNKHQHQQQNQQNQHQHQRQNQHQHQHQQQQQPRPVHAMPRAEWTGSLAGVVTNQAGHRASNSKEHCEQKHQQHPHQQHPHQQPKQQQHTLPPHHHQPGLIAVPAHGFAMHAGQHQYGLDQQQTCAQDSYYNGSSKQVGGVSVSVGAVAAAGQARAIASLHQPQHYYPTAPSLLGDAAVNAAPMDANAVLQENIKNHIKMVVRAVCNIEYRTHHSRQSATDAVKQHLKTVAANAQNKLMNKFLQLSHSVTKDTNGLEQLSQLSCKIDESLAFEEVFKASKRLVPSYHWLSPAPDRSDEHARPAIMRPLVHQNQH